MRGETRHRQILRTHGGRPVRGLSIVDSMIAFVIVIIAVLAFFGIVPAAMLSANQGAAQIQALGVAEQYLEAIRHDVTAGGNAVLPAPPLVAVDPGESLLGTGIGASSSGDFSVTSNGCPLVAGSTLRYDCAVTVSWTQGKANRSVSLETYVTHQ